MADLDRIKRNVAKMAQMNAPESDIDGYIASEGVTLEQVRSHKIGSQTSQSTNQPVKNNIPDWLAKIDQYNQKRNEEIKKNAKENLRKRAEWEEKHPFISGVQKDYLPRIGIRPSYRGQVPQWEMQAQYGAFAPINEKLKTDLKTVGLDLVPAVNIAVDMATGGGGKVAKEGLKQLIKEGAKQGAKTGVIGGLTQGITSSLADNGISADLLTRPLSYATGGLLGGTLLGGVAPVAMKGVEKVVGKIAKPKVKAQTVEQPQATKEVKAEVVEQPQQLSLDFNKVDDVVTQPIEKQSEVFYTPWNTEVIKNPTNNQKQSLVREYRRENPNSITNDDPIYRTTYDTEGNEYVWKASDSVHEGMENFLKDKFGVNANQDISTLNREYLKKYRSNPEQYSIVLKQLQNYEDDVIRGNFRGSFDSYLKQADDIIPEQVVEATQPTQKQSKFIQTVKNSDLATDELKGKVNANYQTITNQETLQNAQNIIDNDFEGSIRKVLTNDKPEALDIAMAEDLARRLQQTGNPRDLETAVDIIERTATSLSKAGQTIQAASMWGRLTPEGSLLAYQREINRNIPKEVKEIIDNANSIIKKANTATTSKEAENIIRTGLKGLALTPKEKIVKQLKAGYDKNGKIDVDELVNAVKEKYNIKTITPDDIQEFNQLSKNVENATDKRQRDIAVALLKRKIEEVTQSSMGRKISTLQTAGQLLNPKTFIRNLGGNTLYGGVEDLTQTFIATPLDKLTSLRTGQRTIVPTNLATQFGGAKQGLTEGVEDVLKGVDTSPSNTKYDLFSGRTFRNKNTDRTNLSDIWEADSSNKAEVTKQYFNELLTKSRLGQAITERDLAPLKKMPGELANSIETLLNLSLRVPDRAAYQAVYNEAVENMLRAEKITNRGVVKELKQKLAKTKSENRKASIIKKIENLENPTPTDDILAQAQLEALQRTFQDTNQISSTAQGFKRWLNANKDFGLGDLTIKYPKTPANILSRGIDYSPIGLGRGLWNSKGLIFGNAPYNQRVANMEIARGLMGTGLYGGGLYSAANLGVRGKREDKQKLQQNLMAQGNRPYSIPVGNKSYSYDWAVPISMSYGGGANLNYGDDVIESILSASDPLTEQPLLQGARRILGGNYQDIPQALVGEVIGLPSSFYPAVARQTAQSIDPYYRETKSDKKGLLGTAETAVNRLKSNIPFYSKTLPIKYDVTGQPIRRAETAAGRIGQAFFNPANVSIRPDNETLDKSVNLYDYTGDSGALYPVANNKITISGEEKRLTSQERSDYQHDLGRITQSIRTNLFNDEEFNQLTEDEQVKQLEKYHNAINNAVKYRLFGVEPQSYKKLTNEILEYYDEY